MSAPPAGPNAAGQKWLKDHHGRVIRVTHGDMEWQGELCRWDHYNIILKGPAGAETLIKQGPGMTFRAIKQGDSR